MLGLRLADGLDLAWAGPPDRPEALGRLARPGSCARAPTASCPHPRGPLRPERRPARAHGVRVTARGGPPAPSSRARRSSCARSWRSTSPPGTPVGSKNIAGREGIDFASSTVRYELARLEELGFLDHPHTSAGRVPTDQGYRYYVDTLLVRDPPARPPAMVSAALDAHGDAAGDRRRPRPARGRRGPGHQPARHRHRAAARVLDRPPRRGPAAAAPARDGRGHHLHRRGHQARVRLRRPGRSGPLRVGGGVPQRAARRPRRRRAHDRLAHRRPVAGPARAGVPRGAIAPALVDLEEGAVGGIFVGGQARFLAEQRHLDLHGDRRAHGEPGGALPAPGLPARAPSAATRSTCASGPSCRTAASRG